MARHQRLLPRRQIGIEIVQRLRGLVLDPRNLLADIAAGRRQRAQFVDLGLEFGDGFFKIEIGAHGIRHQINIGANALGGEADFGSREESTHFQSFSAHSTRATPVAEAREGDRGRQTALSAAEGAEVKASATSLFLRQRMQVAHQALQPLLDHMGVDLRGRDVGMAEQRLHDAQIGAVVQQMAGKGMAQHMRADQPRREAGGCRQFLQVAREMLPRQMAAFAERGKQPFRAGARFSSSPASALRSPRDNRPSPAATPRSAAPAVPCRPCRAPRSCGHRAATPTAAAPPVPTPAGRWRRAPRAGNTAASRAAAAARRLPALRVSALARVSRRSTSAIDKTLGRPRPRLGPDRIAAGSSRRIRSLSRKRNRCRIADSRRATVDD